MLERRIVILLALASAAIMVWLIWQSPDWLKLLLVYVVVVGWIHREYQHWRDNDNDKWWP